MLNDKRFWITILIAMAAACVLLAVGPANASPQRGYISRACGFDTDHDGNPGEAGECNYCDGVTTNPDGDPETEDQVYVDCNSGTDSATACDGGTTHCGQPECPCRTIQYALDSTSGSANTDNRIDGTGDGAEDIICARATCASYNGSAINNRTTTNSGVTGYVERAASGSEQWAFRYPSDPFMIVGWDTDNDGDYPPHDTDQPEPLVFDGCGSAAGCTNAAQNAFITFGSTQENVEFAHFTVKNYAKGSTSGPTHVFRFVSASGVRSHYNLHDIILESNLAGPANSDGRRTINFQESGANGRKYVNLENIRYTDHGGYASRGHNGESNGQYVRAKNIDIVNPHEPPSGHVLGFRWWNIANVEVLDSKFQGLPGPFANSVRAVECTVDLQNCRIVNNEFVDMNKPIEIRIHDDGNFGPAGPHKIIGNTFRVSPGRTTLGSPAQFIILGEGAFDGADRSECDNGCTPRTGSCSDPNCGEAGGCKGLCAADPCGSNSANYTSDCDCDQNGDADGVSWLDQVDIESNLFDFGDLTDTNIQAAVAINIGSNCSSMAGTGPFNVLYNTVLNYRAGTSGWPPRAAFQYGTIPSNNWWDYKYMPGTINHFGNIVDGLVGGYAVINLKRGDDNAVPLDGIARYVPGTTFFADKNIYRGSSMKFLMNTCATDGDCGTGGECRGSGTSPVWARLTCEYSSFSEWDNAVGAQENNSLSCDPGFDTDGYHLTTTASTSCARNNGEATYCPAVDIDGEARPQDGTCDIGADEVFATTPPGVLALSSGSYTATEGQANNLIVTVDRSGGSSGAATVGYTVTPGTATGCSTCDGSAVCDYDTDIVAGTGCTGGTCSWADADSGSKTFEIVMCNDSTVEGAESLTITLSGAAGATLGSPDYATLNLLDDEEVVGYAPSFDVIRGTKTACNDAQAHNVITIPDVVVAGNAQQPNKILVVVTGAESANDCDLSLGGASVTWGATSLTRAKSAKGADSNGYFNVCSGIFYLLNPSQSTQTVTVTYPANVNSSKAAAFSIYNAAQIPPAATSNPGGPIPSGQGILEWSSDITTLITDTLVVDAFTIGNRVGGGNMTVLYQGQTERADISFCDTDAHMAASTTVVPTPAVVPVGWKWQSGEAYRFAHALAGFSAVESQPGTTTTTTTTTGPPPTVTTTTTTTLPINKRGRIGVGRILRLCEAASEPACNGTCPAGQKCKDTGAQCECQ